MLYFHSYKSPGLVVDLVGDIRRLNDMSVRARKAGMIILGGGVCKHQIANAMLFVSAARAECESVLTPSALCRGMARTTQCTSTRARSLTAQTAARGPTRPSAGARSRARARVSRCVVRALAPTVACSPRLARLTHLLASGVLRRDHHLPPHRGADVRQSALGCTKTAGRKRALACR